VTEPDPDAPISHSPSLLRRGRLLAGGLVVLVTVVATPLLAAGSSASSGSSAGPRQEEGQDQELVEQGRRLYLTGCSSCHGPDGKGIPIEDGGAGGPSLEHAGEAGAYFFLSTGRMPLANTDEEPTRKEPAYSPDQIDALVAYVASLGDGPELPDVDTADADLAEGGRIYRANCQACHSASGSGGALSYGNAAPALESATNRQVGAAVRVGPGEMPVFGHDSINDRDLDDLVKYVEHLRSPADPGGLPIGRTGPIPEGFVAWLVGIPAFLLLAVWIGTRSPIRSRREAKS
jgi:ubiquinol-cytochrome c reductase cytochrome c subunit